MGKTKTPLEHYMERLDWNEKRVRQALADIQRLREGIVTNIMSIDVKRMLGDEKYRIMVAMTMETRQNKIAQLLSMNERTYFRKKVQYGLQNYVPNPIDLLPLESDE